MKKIWTFGKYEYVVDERRVFFSDRLPVKLPGKMAELLLAVLEKSTEVVPTGILIARIWQDTKTVGADHLRKLKFDLGRKLGDNKLIEYIGGCRLTVPARLKGIQPSATSLDVFPGAGSVFGTYYVHSWVGSGGDDTVEFKMEKSPFDPVPRQMAYLSQRYPSTLEFPFAHTPSRKDRQESWWSAAIPIQVNPKTGEWQGADLNDFHVLEFEARAGRRKTHVPLKAPVPMRVRMEDGSTSAHSGSFRQSTSWYPEPILLVDHFRTFSLRLDDFDWSRRAWAWNAASVKRNEIVQVVFGQDQSVPACSGIIEIRNIRFLVDQVETDNESAVPESDGAPTTLGKE